MIMMIEGGNRWFSHLNFFSSVFQTLNLQLDHDFFMG